MLTEILPEESSRTSDKGTFAGGIPATPSLGTIENDVVHNDEKNVSPGEIITLDILEVTNIYLGLT